MSRARQLRKKARKGTLPVPEVDGLVADDPQVRGRAVRSLCPCRVGWSPFEEHLADLERLCKDRDPQVRFNALHVREDAALMELRADRGLAAREAAERRAARDAAKRARAQRKSSPRTR
jgi:hypothetical protein